MIFDHLPKLLRLNAKLIDVVLETFKLFIDEVHYVLLRFRGIGQLLIVRVFAHINLVLKTERLYVPRHPQNRLSLNCLYGLPLMLLF